LPCLCLFSQGALILKILRGKFPPVTGYSPELQDIVRRCLTQAAQKRPSADRIISLPAVQEKASQLGISLPGALENLDDDLFRTLLLSFLYPFISFAIYHPVPLALMMG
jgi:serine/threonine protein kinase